MAVSQTLPKLVLEARSTAKASQDRIADVLKLADGQALSDAQVQEIASAMVAIELAAVDIFSVFEARMQGHFKRGPLSLKVKAALIAARQTELADRLHEYYLAINVLKHGMGASLRELQKSKSAMQAAPQAATGEPKSEGSPMGLIDVTAPHFFDGLAETIVAASQFLENRKGSSV